MRSRGIPGGLRSFRVFHEISGCSNDFQERSRGFQRVSEAIHGTSGSFSALRGYLGESRGISVGGGVVLLGDAWGFKGFETRSRGVLKGFRRFKEHSMCFRVSGKSQCCYRILRGFQGVLGSFSYVPEVFPTFSWGFKGVRRI